MHTNLLVEELPEPVAVRIIKREIEWNRILEERDRAIKLKKQKRKELSDISKYITLNMLLQFNAKYNAERNIDF